jgi:orotidine-5'-phosphate decarboxylase
MTPRTATPIVALDYPNGAAAMALVDRLGDRCRFYKVGNELFTAEGPDVVRGLRDKGVDVFLDLKFHDIPNTVAGAVRVAAALGVRLTTVHASGGSAMLAAAVAAAGDQTRCGILAVTVLTSLTAAEVAESWGRAPEEVESTAEVLRLSRLAAASGAYGVVCSGREAAAVRSKFGSDLAVLIPGVRPAGAAAQDQARVVTPREAVDAGATYLVLGRAVTGAPDPAGAMDCINAEVAAAAR